MNAAPNDIETASSVSGRRLRVLILSIVPSPYQRDLFAALNDRPEIELSVVYCERGSPDSPWAKKELRDFETVLPGFYLSWGGSRFLVNRDLPDLSDVDLLILNGYMTLAAQRLLRKWVGKLPVLFWGERMVGSFSGLKGMVQKCLAEPLKKIDGIVAIGSRAEKDYAERFLDLPIFNLPYYCDLSEFIRRKPVSRPHEPITILFCGQMIARKGVDVLFEAFVKLVKYSKENLRLLLVGREAEVYDMMRPLEKEVRECVDYVGFQQPETLPAYFAQADIFVLPSRYDGWGVVVNQALGAGLPVICSDEVGAGFDLVDEGENGYVFKADDADDLLRCLKPYVDDPQIINQASKHSSEKAEAWSPEKGAAKWITIFEELNLNVPKA